MKAEIISIGTELLLGSIVDTNAAYLAGRLPDLGIDCYYISQLGDNQQRLAQAFDRALRRSDLVVTTGGLGPTGDDLTREAIAQALGEQMEVVPELEERLLAFYRRRGALMPPANLKQATLIPSAQAVANPIGTAPGWWVETEREGATRRIVSMPGVPFEMRRMWVEEVEPRLMGLSGMVLVSRTLKTLGIGESAAEEMVADLMTGSNPTLAPYAKQDGVHFRISAKATSESEAQSMIEGLEQQVRARLGRHVYGVNDETPAGALAAVLTQRGLRVAVVEVGAGAVGSASAMLAGSDVLAGALGFASDARSGDDLLGVDAASPTGTLRGLMVRSEAQVGLLVEARQESAEERGDVVVVTATIRVLAGERAELNEPGPAAHRWKTARSEASRLIALSAINMLRLWATERYTGH